MGGFGTCQLVTNHSTPGHGSDHLHGITQYQQVSHVSPSQVPEIKETCHRLSPHQVSPAPSMRKSMLAMTFKLLRLQCGSW